MEMQQRVHLLLWNVVQLQNMSYTFQQYKHTQVFMELTFVSNFNHM